jgi:hypothetical protein
MTSTFRKVKVLALTLSVAAPFLLSVAQAQTSITVNNFSFENDPPYTGGGVMIPSLWTAFNDNNFSGVLTGNFPTIPDGTQYFGINEGPSDSTGGIYQDVGMLQANTDYTLTVAIGLRSDFTPGSLGSPGIISLINGTDDTGALESSNSGIPTTPGTWEDFTTSFTTGSSVNGDLTVELSLNPASTFQADFDNVRLTESAVPEPSVYASFAGGLGLLWFIVRRRKQISAN